MARWRLGRTHIHCFRCDRDLDWAEQAFLAAHPQPTCGPCCALGLNQTTNTPIQAVAEVLSTTPAHQLAPTNESFLLAVAEAEGTK